MKKKNIALIIVLILFLVNFGVYLKGAFSYPYLEDDDSYSHAKTVKYILTEKSLSEPYEGKNLFGYLDPRPPLYPLLMSFFHIFFPMQFTLKFFNALIVSSGIIFFYFFTKKLTGNVNKSLFATFIFTMIPCYLSHFIWSHSLAVTLFLPAFYCLLWVKEKKWCMIPASLIIAGIFLTQETQAIKFVLLTLVLIIIRKDLRAFLSLVIGGVISFTLWWGPMLLKYGLGFFSAYGLGGGGTQYLHPSITKVYWGFLGSATRQHGIYTFKDFFTATANNMINNPYGVGVIICLLAILGVVYSLLKYKELKTSYSLIIVLWFLIIFLGIHGGTHWWSPVALFSFRFWSLFAIPTSILAAEGLWFWFSFLKNKEPKIILVVILIPLIFFTSGMVRYKINSTPWNPGGRWTSMEEVELYTKLKELPKNSKVFTLTETEAMMVIGMNQESPFWKYKEIDTRNIIIHNRLKAIKIYNYMIENNYQYFITSGMTYKYLSLKFGENETVDYLNNLTKQLTNSTWFEPVFYNKGGVIWKVLPIE